MALAPLESTLMNDFWNKRAAKVDVTGAIQPAATTQADVDSALAWGLENEKNKRTAGIQQQNADTARFAAEQEARALDKAIQMNRTALPFQLAQQAFGAQGLMPWLFGGTSGQGAGATTYPGVVNQVGGAIGQVGSALGQGYDWLKGLIGGGSSLVPEGLGTMYDWANGWEGLNTSDFGTDWGGLGPEGTTYDWSQGWGDLGAGDIGTDWGGGFDLGGIGEGSLYDWSGGWGEMGASDVGTDWGGAWDGNYENLDTFFGSWGF